MNKEEFLSAKNTAFRYVVYKRRTVSEVYNKLEKLGYSSDIINKILDELICFEYLDDKKYIEKFTEKNKKDSVGLLKMKLLNKGINKELIEEHFSNNIYDETDKIVTLLNKKKYDDNLEDSKKNKIKAYCVRHGFKISDIERAVKRRKEDAN